MRHDPPTWSEEKIAKLRELWPDRSLGLSEIGRRLGMSRNAVSGKAHRLHLEPRPCPIKAGPSKKPEPERATDRPRPQRKPVRVEQQPEIYKPEPKCCWPIGEPSQKGFRYCDAPVVPGYSYCPEHKKLAYVPKPTPLSHAA